MSFDNMPATLFSPAKIAYVGFLVLAGIERIEPPAWVYVVVSLLNRKAEAKGAAYRKGARPCAARRHGGSYTMHRR